MFCFIHSSSVVVFLPLSCLMFSYASTPGFDALFVHSRLWEAGTLGTHFLCLALDVAPQRCWVYSLALTVVMLILRIRDDLVEWFFAMATDHCWFRSTMAGGFACGDSVNASFCGQLLCILKEYLCK